MAIIVNYEDKIVRPADFAGKSKLGTPVTIPVVAVPKAYANLLLHAERVDLLNDADERPQPLSFGRCRLTQPSDSVAVAHELFLLGMEYHNAKLHAKALDYFSRAVVFNPRHADAINAQVNFFEFHSFNCTLMT